MGQRANLIIVENQSYTLYYDHWCANSMDAYLFWGEKEAVNFFREHEKTNDWLDPVWCEGGAVIDLDRKVLLFFGGEDILYDLELRLVYLDLLAMNWPDYEIRWAWLGIVDLSDYVGYDRSSIVANVNNTKNKVCSLEQLRFIDGEASVISIENEQGIFIYPIFNWHIEDILCYGTELVDVLQTHQSQAFTTYQPSEEESFSLGVHIQTQSKTVYYWASCHLTQYFDDFPDKWQNWAGWRIVWLKDQYMEHQALMQGHYTRQARTLEQKIETIKNIVCHERLDPQTQIQTTLQTLVAKGYDVEVDEAVFASKAFRPTQTQSFEQIVARYLATKPNG